MAVSNEAAAIAALLYEAFAEYKPLFTEKGFTDSTPVQKEIEDRIAEKAVWVAVFENDIAGTVSILPCHDGLFLRSMAVGPGARGKGIGKALLDHVHQYAFEKGCPCLKLDTTPFLSAAIRLYESFGFKQQGSGDLYGTPLIIMTKTLEQVIKTKTEKNEYAK